MGLSRGLHSEDILRTNNSASVAFVRHSAGNIDYHYLHQRLLWAP
jgi:hypothetical protein